MRASLRQSRAGPGTELVPDTIGIAVQVFGGRAAHTSPRIAQTEASVKRTSLGITLLTLAALAAAGCASHTPVGPSESATSPSLARGSRPNPDRNGNTWYCTHQVGHEDNGSGGPIGAAVQSATTDDDNLQCPSGFQLRSTV